MAAAITTVRKVAEEDIEKCVMTLVAAFANDPVTTWTIRQDRFQGRAMVEQWRDRLRQRVPVGETYMESEARGVTIWAPPGRKHVMTEEELRERMPNLKRYSGRRARRSAYLLRTMQEMRPEEPHWYLNWIGVHPDHQGLGIGSTLIRHQTLRLDKTGAPAYLVSTKAGNIPIYERHGFHIIEKRRFQRQGPLLWRMWRDAQNADKAEPGRQR